MSATPKLLHFACDRCMNRWSAYRASECPACRHESVWEFASEKKRDQYVRDHERLFVRHD